MRASAQWGRFRRPYRRHGTPARKISTLETQGVRDEGARGRVGGGVNMRRKENNTVHSHNLSIRSHRGTKVVWPDFQPMRVPEEPVCIDLIWQKPVFTSLHLKYPVHVVRSLFFPAKESPRRTGLHWSISAKSSFYLRILNLRSCRTASGKKCWSRKTYFWFLLNYTRLMMIL